ncbi:MAG: branched-chain amino acid ABC transporter permease, partial [Rhodoferax sp.]
TLVMVFVTMAVVLALRPQGLLGHMHDADTHARASKFERRPTGRGGQAAAYSLCLLLALVAWQAGAYWQSLMADALILLIFALSLQAMMALGGLVSFGHAAFFALGAYAAALVHGAFGWGLLPALVSAMAAALAVATLVGLLLVRSVGVYLAMLSLALAQVVWAGASQWVAVSGGDNGLIGLRLVADAQRPAFFALLVMLALGGIALLDRLSRSTLGAALQAVRDAPQRASASGMSIWAIKYRVYLASASVAGLAGGLFAAHQGAVFPSTAAVSTSLDALLVILLGGMQQLWGGAVGAAVLVWAGAELGRGFDYWRGTLGLMVMCIMVLAPSGIVGWLSTRRGARP